ncbi:hypothetical protein CspeluHIS016_0403730 [Cutaneotrichosporon spelunceum]|uniref:Ureidoglycolate hydrolase n=1 Tax=Cutaneotrichosporon spelunceum TaxID=1672016 RepID=A0AAD3TV98_9TREE|nr:hypothetical protein CspeluHIS016_0403730 [Cutaneotrichosporon spelunceum]
MSPVAAAPAAAAVAPSTKVSGWTTNLCAEELTYESFRPYGAVVQGWEGTERSPKGIHVTVANQGTAFKFHRLAYLPQNAEITPERRAPATDARKGCSIGVKHLDRSSEVKVYLPQGRGVPPGVAGLSAGASYLVVVGGNTNNVKAFLATSAQGVSIASNVYHAVIPLNEPIDFAIVSAATTTVTQTDIKVDVPAHTAAPVPPRVPTAEVPEKPVPQGVAINPVPITEELWAPYGELIGARGSKRSPITNSYPADQDGACTSIGLFRATPKAGLHRGQLFDVSLLERHIYTSQAFIPLGKDNLVGMGEAPLTAGGTFLVVVADNGPDDRPDTSTLKSFIMESGMGLNYRAGVWHHPVLTIDACLDLACIETQVSTGEFGKTYEPDCELVEYDRPIGQINVPALCDVAL